MEDWSGWSRLRATTYFDSIDLAKHVLHSRVDTERLLLLVWRYQRRRRRLTSLQLGRNNLLLLALLLLQLVVEAVEDILLVQ